jgi:hypothetical protein
MMPPRPSARRRGANTWQPCTTPHRLTPTVQCQSSMGMLADGAAADADPGVVDHQVHGIAEPLFGFLREGLHLLEARDVAGQRQGPPPHPPR